MAYGGKREGAGRPKGVKDRVTVELKATLTDTAKAYTVQAMQALADIMLDEKAPAAARATCANSILDRGWGKPAQPLTGKDGLPLFDMSRLNDDELSEFERLARKAAVAGTDTGGADQTQH